MNFGLGLVLSFTDNASTGINNAVNSLNTLTSTAESAIHSLDSMASLSALSVVSGQLGNAFMSMGGNIIGSLTGVIGKVNETGQTLMYAEKQLDALYGGVGKGKEVIGEIQEYAKTSMFEFKNLIPAVTSLKSVGIEAFDNIARSTGDAKNNLLDYASALASFAPQMRNAYGTGINAAIGAMREYIAEGNAMSLKRGAGLDITQILGEDKGASVEERTRQVADLIEQLGMLGMVDTMKNNPMTQLSNMGDVLFQTMGMIAESGVYDKFTQLISKLAEYVMAIPEDELKSIANTIGSALTTIMQPLEWVVDKILSLADGIRKLVETNPKLIKIATIGVTLVGILLLLGGVVLKATSAFSGLSLMLLVTGKSFNSIGKLIRAGSLKMMKSLLPLILVVGALTLAWKKDFAGIRTSLTSFVSNVTTSFKTARQAINGSVSEMTNTLNNLRNKGDFYSNITIGLMKLMIVFRAVSEAWNDFELSEDTFEKAKELGVLPLIEAILDLKYRFGLFKDGFIDGWLEIGDKIKTAIAGFTENVEGTFLEDMIENVTTFLSKLASGDSQAWYDFGKSFAEFTANALALFLALKAINTVLGVFSKVATLIGGIGKIGGFVIKIVTGIGKIFAKTFPFITEVFKGIGMVIKLLASGASLETALTTVFTPLAGVVSIISGVITAILSFFSMLKNGFSWVKEIFMVLGIALTAIGAIILGAPALVAGIIAGIVALLATLVVVIKDNLGKISAFLSKIGSWIYKNIIQPVATFFSNLWKGIVEGVTTSFNAVKSFLSTIASWIYNNVIQPVVNFFTTIIFPIISKIVEIVMKIIEIVVTLVSVFVQWVKTNVIDPIISFFVSLWNIIVEGVTSFIETAKSIIGTIVEWINTNIISPVSSFFSGLWEDVTEGISSFIEGAKEKFLAVVEWIKTNIIDPISSFFSTLWEGITTAFDTVKDTITEALKGAVNTVLDFICGLINGVIKGINSAIGVINDIPGVHIDKIELLEVPKLAQGGVVENPTLSIVGEAGAEAVMPLENNTGWIGKLAGMITTQMENIRPVNNSQISTTNQGDSSKYLTNHNTTNNQTIEGDTDNSVVFNEGSIQLVVQNASEEEAMRFAKMTMEYIRRQQELDRMTSYGY